MSSFKLLLAQIGVVLITARLLGWLFRRLYQPRVIGKMVAGILLGPSLRAGLRRDFQPRFSRRFYWALFSRFIGIRGLVELVILNIGLDLGILSPALFSMMVLMALVTTLLTTPLGLSGTYGTSLSVC